MLKLSVKVGERVQIGEHGFVRVEWKAGNQVALAFDLPEVRPIRVMKGEDRQMPMRSTPPLAPRVLEALPELPTAARA